MKFCRNLQRVIDITDPEWAPYWTNYKMLKKFLKALVPPDAVESSAAADGSPQPESSKCEELDDCRDEEQVDKCDEENSDGTKESTLATATASLDNGSAGASSADQMSRNPGEVAFFRLLNSELKKAIHFFDKAQLEIEIRESRVREGINIMRKANSLMVNEKWTLMAKSLYRLYKDLLLLETYAIMTYCSFSKILKKHDKVTKHNTRVAFMKNVVNKANFTHYPKLLAMISRCERLYENVSQSLIIEGKSGLYEDERLFINMIHRLNEQVLDTAEGEGAPDTVARKEQRRFSLDPSASPSSSRSSLAAQNQADALRSLVEENAMNKSSKDGLARVAESEQALAALTKEEKSPDQEEDVEEQATAAPTTAPLDELDCGSKRSFVAEDAKAELQPCVKRTKSEL